MNRIGLCATIVAALSAISFPVGALMSGSAAGHDASTVLAKGPVDTSAPALSPDGKPVRIISLSVNDRSGDLLAASVQPERPQLVASDPAPISATKPIAVSEGPAEAPVHPVLHVRSAPKRTAAAPRVTRVASASAKKAFIVSGLY